MKTFEHSGVTIHHNSSRTGEAIIDVRTLEVEELSDQNGTYYSFKLPCAALAAFSWEAAMSKIIEIVEQVDFPEADEDPRLLHADATTLLHELAEAAGMRPSHDKLARLERVIAAVGEQAGTPAAAGCTEYVRALMDGRDEKAQALRELILRGSRRYKGTEDGE